jgi:hypothetical protein
MKKYTTLLFIILTIPLFAQTNTIKTDSIIVKESFIKSLNNVLSEYSDDGSRGDNKIIIQQKLLNERLNQAFNQTVFSSSSSVNNATAFGINQNEEKTNVSINGNIRLNSNNKYFVKVGGNANGSGSIFNLYDDDEWQSSVGGSIGFILKIGGSGYTGEQKTKFLYNNALRKVFVKDSLLGDILNYTPKKYRELREKYKKNLNCILEDINDENIITKETICKKELEKNYNQLLKYENYWKKLLAKFPENERDLSFNNYDEIISNDSIIMILYNELIAKNNKMLQVLENEIKEVAYIYDKKNIKNTGYSLHWFDVNARLNNNAYNFSEKAENIKNETLEAFNDFEAQKTGINRLKTVITGNYNYTKNTSNIVIYGQLGLRFNSGSFLDSNLLNGKAIISESIEGNDFTIEDEDGLSLGNFNNIGSNLQFGSFDGYIAFYFGTKKNFGFNVAATHNYKIKTPDDTFYENNYSVLFGPIFRQPKNKDDTGLTFGIDVGFANSVYGSKASNDFVARIRVGIPIKMYNINK